MGQLSNPDKEHSLSVRLLEQQTPIQFKNSIYGLVTVMPLDRSMNPYCLMAKSVITVMIHGIMANLE